MSLKNEIKRFFVSVTDNFRREKRASQAWGILVFEHTSLVIRAEAELKANHVAVEVKGPPPQIRTGCDLVIQFPLVEQLRVVRILEEHDIRPLQVAAVQDDLLQPVDIYHIADLGPYLMVRAANMKITIDRNDRRIVNVSGGGCPDVPYLARVLVGCTLNEAPDPRSLGHTLCGYALHLAFVEASRRC